MSDRYIVTSTQFPGGIVWYVKDTNVPEGLEAYIVARCHNEADARQVCDALNGPGVAEKFVEYWLRERMQADETLVEMAMKDFRGWRKRA